MCVSVYLYMCVSQVLRGIVTFENDQHTGSL
eukprot:COSAG06_NODE_38163_length_426_cov_1.403670_1_plen_30_part_01